MKCDEQEWSKAKAHIIYQYLYNDTNQANQKKEMNTFSNRNVTQTESYIAREHTKMLARTTSTCKNKSEQKRKNNLRWLATINVNIPSMCRFVRVSWLFLFFFRSLLSFPFRSLRFFLLCYLFNMIHSYKTQINLSNECILRQAKKSIHTITIYTYTFKTPHQYNCTNGLYIMFYA